MGGRRGLMSIGVTLHQCPSVLLVTSTSYADESVLYVYGIVTTRYIAYEGRQAAQLNLHIGGREYVIHFTIPYQDFISATALCMN